MMFKPVQDTILVEPVLAFATARRRIRLFLESCHSFSELKGFHANAAALDVLSIFATCKPSIPKQVRRVGVADAVV